MIAASQIIDTFVSTVGDVIPITVIIFGFQFAVLRRPIANFTTVILGFVYVLVGLSLFLMGLELALFPLGKTMAQQLTAPEFLQAVKWSHGLVLSWQDYYWVYLFAF